MAHVLINAADVGSCVVNNFGAPVHFTGGTCPRALEAMSTLDAAITVDEMILVLPFILPEAQVREPRIFAHKVKG